MFRLKPINTDFVLTKLATRCQTSDNNWQKKGTSGTHVVVGQVKQGTSSIHQNNFSTGRDKQCKGRTKHGRKERIHSCHHWVDPSMTLGRTGHRTIGSRRHGAQQLITQDSGIQNATEAQIIVDFSSTRNTLAARMCFFEKNHCFSSFFIFSHFFVKKEQKREDIYLKKSDLKKHFPN